MSFQELEEETAIAMMGILSTSENEEFKELLTDTLKTMAEHKKGLFAMCAAWCGTDLPANMREQLHETFGTEFLYQRNVLSCDGDLIELNVLCGAMPDVFLENFFHFDIKERADKEGVSIPEIEDFIRETYRGLDEDGDYLFEFEKAVNRYKYFSVLGVSGFGRSKCKKYHKIYANMNNFGIQNIRNILFRNSEGVSNDSGTQETAKA
jgi:hypothetical protein